jgi:hypothetical protein
MPNRGPLYRLRSFVAARFGIADERARDGTWWEIDLVIVFFAGVIAWGFLAWL